MSRCEGRLSWERSYALCAAWLTSRSGRMRTMGLRRLQSGRTRSCDAASTFRNAGTALISSPTPVRIGHARCKMPLSRSVGRHLFDPVQEGMPQKTDEWAPLLQSAPINVLWRCPS